MRRLRGCWSLSLVAALALTACERPLAPRHGPVPESKRTPLGLVEVTLSGVTQGPPTVSVRSGAVLAGAVPGVSLDLTPAGGRPSGGVQLEPFSTGSFTRGTRGVGGVRYIFATFRVRNADASGNAYGTARTNLTFLAVSTGSTINGTAISELRRFDGSPAAEAIALQVIPTGAVAQAPGAEIISTGPDVLQVFDEGDLTGIDAPAGVGLLPYGFMVRHTTSTTTRTLGANPSMGQFEGLVTFAFKLPLQGSAAEDPFTVSAMFLAVDDSETRVTQSPEEQTVAGAQAAQARARDLNAALTDLPGTSTSVFAPAPARVVCAVRTAGPGAAPAEYLVNQVPATLVVWPQSQEASPLPLPLGGKRAFTAAATDARGTPLVVPVIWSNTGQGAVAFTSSGGASWLAQAVRSVGRVTITAQACGLTSAPVAVRVAYLPTLVGGDAHSLALRLDGTVVGWGSNAYGQATPPAALTDPATASVVALAAGGYHSLALRADSTVVSWAEDAYTGVTPPPWLTDPATAHVAAIAAGGLHSLALLDDGTVEGWGWDTHGEVVPPGALRNPATANVVAIAAGEWHSLALRADGTVVGWGEKADGQATPPAALTDPATAHVVAISAGVAHNVALRADGTVVGWGYNSSGQVTLPAALTDPATASVVAIAAGGYHSLALRADGTVVGWGYRAAPPAALTDPATAHVVAIAAGRLHSLALRADGTVVGWGHEVDEFGIYQGQATPPPGLVVRLP